MKQFYTVPCLVHKDEHISITDIKTHMVGYKTAQCVVTFAHIGRFTVEKVPHAVVQAKHDPDVLLKL